MLVYHDLEREREASSFGREHPWTTASADPSNFYVDLKAAPYAVDTFEDILRIRQTMGADAIKSFLRTVNGNNSKLETNDFGLRPLKANHSGISQSALELEGRFTFLFRNLQSNTDRSVVVDFLNGLQQKLEAIDPTFNEACWGWCLWPHLFIALRNEGEDAEGDCFVFMFWAWGDSEADVHQNLIRALANLRSCMNPFLE